MGLFKRGKNGGFMDEIRCDEPSYLIWKWHPKGSKAGDNTRENAIRWGSSLRVKDGEVAVFVYNQNDDTQQDFIVGPFDKAIKTENLPVLASIVGLAYDGGTPFQAEVYFINLAQIIQIQFGVPYFDVYDPRFLDFGVPIAVRGTLSFKISDYKQFIKLHRLINFNLSDFSAQIKDVICRYVKNVVANTPSKNNIPVIRLESMITEINNLVSPTIKDRLYNDFGVDVSGVDIGAIEIDKSSDGYYQLMKVTKNVDAAKIQAQTTDYVERLRIQREEGQYAVHKQTQSANLGAFQIEKQAEVGIAGAEALGEMGKNGAGDVSLGNGAGVNMAAMMASMAVGGAVGQNIAGTMNTALTGATQQMQNGITPPPLLNDVYYVAIDGQATGPFDIQTLAQMITLGTFNKKSLVWKKGMEDWEVAENVPSILSLFDDNEIPPLPKNI